MEVTVRTPLGTPLSPQEAVEAVEPAIRAMVETAAPEEVRARTTTVSAVSVRAPLDKATTAACPQVDSATAVLAAEAAREPWVLLVQDQTAVTAATARPVLSLVQQ
jgi:hypothetical protein